MNFSRKMIFVVGAAFLAACGDKVTVAAPTPATPAVTKINSVDVAPLTATISAGQTIAFTAAVNADAGVTVTTAWSTSSSNISVSSAGVVATTTATVGGSYGVCATATAGTQSVKGCATLIVTTAPAAIPASVSINSIQVTGAVGGATVNPANVNGGIDITLNVNPGNQTVSKIVLLVGGARADSQMFTAAQSAAMRFAADEAVAAQTTFPQIVFSVNTAKFNATTGAPTWLNGTQAVSAQLYTTQGGTASAATASAATSLTFNNANTFASTVTMAGTSANNTAGFRYTKGDIAVSVIPVIYTSGVSVASASITFGNAAGTTCQSAASAAIIPGQRAKALTAPVAPSTAWTATLSSTATAAADNVTGYEADYTVGTCAAGTINTGEKISVATAQDGNGNPLITAPLVVGAGYRVDNLAPAAPVAFANPNGRLSGWVNDAVLFSKTQAASVEGMITAAVTDAGVGGVTYAGKAASYAAATVDAALAAADAASPAALAPSLSPSSYCLIVYSLDAVGNRSAGPAAGTTCAASTQSTPIGVDRAAPTIAFSGGLASSARIATATVAGNFQVTVSDTGSIGNSGMNSANSVMGTVTLRDAVPTTGAGACIVGTFAGGVCSAASVNAAPVFPLVPTGAAVSGFAGAGYLTYTGSARDAAGNLSGSVTRTVVHDATVAVAVFATPLLPASINSNAASLSVLVSDNLDIRDYQWTFIYGATMGGVGIDKPATTVNAFNAATFINASYNAAFSGSFIRQIQEWTAAPWTVGAAVQMSTATAIVRDQTQTTTLATAITAGSIISTSTTDYAAGTNVGTNWLISNAATNVSDGAPTAPAVAANALSVNLNADVEGATATYNSPFSRVDFFILNSSGRWTLLGSVASPVTTDNGSIRRHRYTYAFTPGTTWGLGAKTIRAVGVNAANDGLSTANNVNITITNP